MIAFIWSFLMHVLARRGGVLVLSALMAVAQTGPASSSAASQRKLLDQYCVTCHNQRLKTAGLTLDKLDSANVGEQPEAWEKVVRKLRTGMMPPSGLPRPAAADYAALTVSLENDLDRAAAAKPKLARPSAHRMNRTEWERDS
jgi:cytochrome c551/c552